MDESVDLKVWLGFVFYLQIRLNVSQIWGNRTSGGCQRNARES